MTADTTTNEEPFVGASLNAAPSQLVACTVENDSLLLEFAATWDVRLVNVLVLDPSPQSLSLLAERAELTERHPETAPSVSQLRLIPFRWTFG